MADVETIVAGDTELALVIPLTDRDGNRLDLSSCEVRLFAKGRATGNKPTSNPGETTWRGILCVVLDPPENGEAEAQGIGGLVNLGGAVEDTYDLQAEITNAGGERTLTYPYAQARFVARLT